MEQTVIQKKSISKKVLIFIAIMAIAAGGIFYYFNSKKMGLEIEENATMGNLPGINLEERKLELQQKLDESMIAFSVNTSPVLLSGTSEGNFMLENPEHNAKLLVAEIYLKSTNAENETGELIYKSKAIKPGSYLENIKLDKVLSAGTYEAVVYFKAYHLETQDFIGQTGAAITITINS